MLRLRGDYVPDFRLIDYLVALMSTEQSPALDGALDNGERLKNDLDELGVFDRRMSLYLPFKLRQRGVIGFSGFEARHYSLFESLRIGYDAGREPSDADYGTGIQICRGRTLHARADSRQPAARK